MSSSATAASAPRTEIVNDKNMFALTVNIGDKTYTGALLVALPAVKSKAGIDLISKFDALSSEQLLMATDPAKRASAQGAQLLDAALIKAFNENKMRVALGLPNGLVYDLGGALSIDDTPFSEAAYKCAQMSQAPGHFFGNNGDKNRMHTSASRWLGTLREAAWVDSHATVVGDAKLAALRGKCGSEALVAVGIKRNSKFNVNLYVMAMKFKDDGAPEKLVSVKLFNERTKGAVKQLNAVAVAAAGGRSPKKSAGTKRKAPSSSSAASAASASTASVPVVAPSASTDEQPELPPLALNMDDFAVGEDDAFFDDSGVADEEFEVANKRACTTDSWLPPQRPPPAGGWTLHFETVNKKSESEQAQLEPESVGRANARDLLSQLAVAPSPAMAQGSPPHPMSSLPFLLPPAPQPAAAAKAVLKMPRDNARNTTVSVAVAPLSQVLRAVCSEPVLFGGNDWVETLQAEQPQLLNTVESRYTIKMRNVPACVRAQLMEKNSDAARQFANFAMDIIAKHLEESHDVYQRVSSASGAPSGAGLPLSPTNLQMAAYMHAMKDCGATDDECDALATKSNDNTASFSLQCGIENALDNDFWSPIGSMIFG